MKLTLFKIIGLISVLLLVITELTDENKFVRPFLIFIMFGSIIIDNYKSKPKENTNTTVNKKNLYFIYSAIFLFILFFFIFYFLGKK